MKGKERHFSSYSLQLEKCFSNSITYQTKSTFLDFIRKKQQIFKVAGCFIKYLYTKHREIPLNHTAIKLIIESIIKKKSKTSIQNRHPEIKEFKKLINEEKEFFYQVTGFSGTRLSNAKATIKQFATKFETSILTCMVRNFIGTITFVSKFYKLNFNSNKINEISLLTIS